MIVCFETTLKLQSNIFIKIPVMVNGAMVKRNFTTDYIIGRLLMLNPLSEKIAVHLVSAEGAPEQETSEYTMLARVYTLCT